MADSGTTVSETASIQRYGSERSSSQASWNLDQQHVQYILVAEFALKGGPSMEHQYPTEISGDEHTLAELMLPDQIHKREFDWTIFFLHKNADAGEPADPTGNPPLVYVLNLVITKYEKDAIRGARCKAMAICTRHSFLHIYKPILLLALEEYFRSPTIETLADIYNSVNNMDLSAMPELSYFEKQVLAMSDNKDMFIEKFDEALERVQQTSPQSSARQNMSFIPAGEGAQAPNSGAGARGQKMNVKLTISRDSHEFETKVFYGKTGVPIRVPVAVMPETVGDFSLIQLITTFHTPHAQNPQPFALHPHLTTNGPYTHPIIVLVNALLTEKRIIFLGHGKPSGVVADHVLAACALASGGILRGFTRHAFPYTDLSKIEELLRVTGFIAGVTNPNFANKPEWWDVLCDIEKGRIKISPKIEQVPTADISSAFGPAALSSSDRPDTGDNAFMEDIIHCIQSRFGEKVVRARWRDWVAKFVRIAAAFEETMYGATALWVGNEEEAPLRGHGHVWPDELSKMRDLQANMSRIEGWKGTRSYFSYSQDVTVLYKLKPIKDIDLQHHIDRLRLTRVPLEESAQIFLTLNRVIVTYEEINQFLSVVPEQLGGLHPLALGLFHPDSNVRMAVVELIERISGHLAGKHFYASMNRFYRLSFVRLQQEARMVAESPGAGSSNSGGTRELGVAR